MQLIHGGNLDEIERLFGINKSEIRDFSGNINPMGIPESVKKAIIENIDSVSQYPDEEHELLRESISKYTGVNQEYIMVGNGSTELISAFIRAVKPEKAAIISPAYSEYEREIKKFGGEILLFPLLEKDDFKLDTEKLFEKLDKDTGLLVICNPNNPTGTALNENELEKILIRCKKKDIFVMIDETYAEFPDEGENISASGLTKDYDNLFVIRGTSKFFSVPGLRLGYAMCSNSEIRKKVNSKRDLWSVGSLSVAAGIEMFSDAKFVNGTKKFISSERKRLLKELKTFEFLHPYESKSNFILIKIKNLEIKSSYIFSEMIKKKLLIRDASGFPYLDDSFIRICILSQEDNNLLLEVLREIL
ncbi:MAG: aminotransferase class I/II-fold pyridoxal phosphate-dependent enzyme [Defluviitaleaceae bacterium]|nr:aminotransferase class I/II-fold pyridoxal phosphate-dependent enzyme [Defluviitaleaceae bacterium]